MMPGTPASEVPSVSLSFANNFWGKDDAGVGPMLDRMHFAKVTNDELRAFYAARAAIEEEYSKKLLQLARKPLGSSETGTLRMSCDVIRAEVESMGKAHQSVAQQMHTELEEPLQAFAGGMKERRKIIQNGIEKLLKLKMQQTATVNKARDRYEQDCLKIKGFLAQAHMVMGQEERKNKARLEKTQINLATTSNEYEAAVKVLEETTGRWNRDWKAACDKFQDLEEERIDYTKSSLWNFANIASTVCVSDDGSCEKMRLSLEDCDVEKDITSFIADSGTGQEIPDAPKFINFCRGDAETSSQVSDDENYSVAQFARTMNPSYRASSPPISVFESHHDPNNPLARELGLQRDTQPIVIPQDQINVPPRQSIEAPRPSTASRTVQPDPRLVQAQQQARQQYQQSQAPHNDYPEDGMTQFCRPAAQSDRTAIPGQAPYNDYSEDRMTQFSRPAAQSDRTAIPSPVMPSSQAPYNDYSEDRMTQFSRPAAQSDRNAIPSPVMPPSQAPYNDYSEDRITQFSRPAAQSDRNAIPSPVMPPSQAPYNDYPADGMTQVCRPGTQSDRSTIPSPIRPPSRDSHSDHSDLNSFSSVEPPSGSASPGKPMPLASFPEPSPIEESSFQKKRGFFNSPFGRRKSKPEVETPTSVIPKNRNTWAPASRQNTKENVSPTRPLGRSTRQPMVQDAPRSASPEPVDPRASFQLSVGNNVFDVASPDKKKQQQQQKAEPEELDPITAALEELRGVTKQGSTRVSADRFHGLATPQPSATPAKLAPTPAKLAPTPAKLAPTPAKLAPTPAKLAPTPAKLAPTPAKLAPTPNVNKMLPSSAPTPKVGAKLPGSAPTPLTNGNVNAAKRDAPPPSYEPSPTSHLGAPKPAHTARQMQKTTEMYVNQKANVFNGNAGSRPPTRGATQQEPPRATSPAPNRATSPRPSLHTSQQRSSQQQVPASPSAYRPAQQTSASLAKYRPTQQTSASPSTYRPAKQTPAPSSAYRPVQRQQQQSPAPAANHSRAPSPNPYAVSTAASTAGGRPRAQTTTAPAQAYGTPIGRNSYSSTRGASPARNSVSRAASPQPPQPTYTQSRPASRAAPSSRAASPQPTYTQPPQPTPTYAQSRPASRAAPSSRAVSPQPAFRQSNDRPPSSHSAAAMSIAGSERGDGSVYSGSVRGRPQSSYYGGSGSSVRAESRTRSKSLAEPKNYNKDGRIILNYSRAMYSYTAQIPEELAFQKGDILAVLRLQDDGWWEAEAVGKNGKPGLVPSNYLQPC